MRSSALAEWAFALSVQFVGTNAQADDAPATDLPVVDEPAGATFSGSTATLLEWRNNNRNGDATDDNYADALVRTNLLLDAVDNRITVRINGAGFASRPTGVDRQNYLRLERVTLELFRNLGKIRTQLTVGDFYAQFGSGLALSLRRVDELGLDVAARGGRLDAFLWDDHLQVILLGGLTNSANIEATRLRFTEDPDDALGG